MTIKHTPFEDVLPIENEIVQCDDCFQGCSPPQKNGLAKILSF